jgi:hypothetical protein
MVVVAMCASDALPVCVALVDYAGPEPRNLWANKAHLKTGDEYGAW